MFDQRGFFIATFADPADLLIAVAALRVQQMPIYDVYAPYPIHGLDQAMGLRRTRLPLVTLLAGLGGLTLALLFQYYTNVFDWPLNVGGKPDNSTLAFVPVCFELTVLLGGLSTVGALLLRARLYPGKPARLAAPGVTDHQFALALRAPADAALRQRIRTLLWQQRAAQIDERETPP